MSVPNPDSAEAAISSILRDHFENSENPHETIYRIWLVLNAREVAAFRTTRALQCHDRPDKTWAQ